jgi:hypothetical protein
MVMTVVFLKINLAQIIDCDLKINNEGKKGIIGHIHIKLDLESSSSQVSLKLN